MLRQGKQLVILDDMILDVEKYKHVHPGALFSIENNIGRDISKFYYGGYSMENLNKVSNHAHSSLAARIVRQLMIGYLV